MADDTENLDKDFEKLNLTDKSLDLDVVTQFLNNFYVVFLGLFLSEQSKKIVLEKFPKSHSALYADHVTLVHSPTVEQLVNVPIGKKTKVKVKRHVVDDKGEALILEILDEDIRTKMENGRTPHITISTIGSVNPFYSNELIEKANSNSQSNNNHIKEDSSVSDCYIEVVVGLMANRRVPIVTIKDVRDDIKKRIESFHKGDEKEYKFKPEDLTKGERALVHDICAELGIESLSIGSRGKNRYLTLKKLDTEEEKATLLKKQQKRRRQNRILVTTLAQLFAMPGDTGKHNHTKQLDLNY